MLCKVKSIVIIWPSAAITAASSAKTDVIGVPKSKQPETRLQLRGLNSKRNSNKTSLSST